jgi:hypothetical protein
MEIMINENGRLFVKRAGYYKKQSCPRLEENVACGDWCPLFSEPKGMCDKLYNTQINICDGKVPFGKIIDKRPGVKDEKE